MYSNNQSRDGRSLLLFHGTAATSPDLEEAMNNGAGKGSTALQGDTSAQAMSPEETLKIKRLLTLYLASLIIFPGDHPSHFQLCHPETALEVKEIPKQVIGIRRQYLKELRANLKARQTYQELLASRKGDGRGVAHDGEVGDGTARLETHLKLLQMRKRHKEVQITRHYLEKLKETNPAKDGGLDFRQREADDAGLPDLLHAPNTNGDGSTGENSTEELTKKLERALIRAKYQLEREKRLLAEVKAQKDTTERSGDDAIEPGARIRALAATRDELVRFLEEKILSVHLEDHNVPTNAAEYDEKSALNREEVQKEINAEYERYISTRKRLLDVAAKALASPAESGPRDLRSGHGTKADESRAGAPVPVSTQSTISPLPFISEQLMPLLQSQRATVLQDSYAAEVLKTERANALDSLERLADESHLLPAYPIMARQERFKNVVTALGGPKKLDHTTAGAGNNTDVMIRRAEAWAFAAEEARKAEEDYLKEKVRYGNERLDRAEGSLKMLDELLGRDPQESVIAGGGSGEADVWLEAAGSGTQNAQSRRARASQQEKGPWAGLNGKIGVAGGKEG